MLLTEDLVNSAGIAFAGIGLVGLRRGTGRTKKRRAGTSKPMSLRDAYLMFEHTRENRAEIERSEMCGCLWCQHLYRPTEIAVWVNETAVCPRCMRMTVVGSGAGFGLTRELLHRSHFVGFGEDMRAS
jgi:hypothetical protein